MTTLGITTSGIQWVDKRTRNRVIIPKVTPDVRITKIISGRKDNQPHFAYNCRFSANIMRYFGEALGHVRVGYDNDRARVYFSFTKDTKTSYKTAIRKAAAYLKLRTENCPFIVDFVGDFTLQQDPDNGFYYIEKAVENNG